MFGNLSCNVYGGRSGKNVGLLLGIAFFSNLFALMYFAKHFNNDFRPYVTHFCDVAEKNDVHFDCDSIEVMYVDSEKMKEVSRINEVSNNGVITGFCNPFTKGVYINKQQWLMMPEGERQMAIDHELGHCILGRAHNISFVSGSRGYTPGTIMWPVIIDNGTFLKNQAYYESELFKNKREFGSLNFILTNIKEREKLQLSLNILGYSN